MTTAQTHSEMLALGFNFEHWQDVVEAAIATNQLTVTGEVRGGQLIQFADASGAQLNILAVEPFSTFIGFEGITQAYAHVSMVNDVLSYMNIITPTGDTIAEITANLAQGPLLAEVEEQQWQQVGITAMGLSVQSYDSAEAFESSEGMYPALFESDGAEVINSGNGGAAPTPGARFAARVLESSWRHNQLSGKKFMHVVLDGAFPFDLCLPESFGELPAKDTVLAGTALMTASVLTPMSGCGSGGGCSCGSGGCGGH